MKREYKSRRSTLQIYIDVLEVIKQGAQKPTRIMYQANLSWQPLVKVLQAQVDQGLIERLDAREIARQERKDYDKRTTVLYAITQKGEDVLRHFSKGKHLIGIE